MIWFIELKNLFSIIISVVILHPAIPRSGLAQVTPAQQFEIVGKPEDTGFSSEGIARIDRLITQYVNEGVMPNAATFIARHGKIVSSGTPYSSPLHKKENIPTVNSLQQEPIASVVKRLAKLPLSHDPGEKFTYGLNTDVIGYLIEVLSGKSLAVFFKERIFDPLKMRDTYFYCMKTRKRGW